MLYSCYFHLRQKWFAMIEPHRKRAALLCSTYEQLHPMFRQVYEKNVHWKFYNNNFEYNVKNTMFIAVPLYVVRIPPKPLSVCLQKYGMRYMKEKDQPPRYMYILHGLNATDSVSFAATVLIDNVAEGRAAYKAVIARENETRHFENGVYKVGEFEHKHVNSKNFSDF